MKKIFLFFGFYLPALYSIAQESTLIIKIPVQPEENIYKINLQLKCIEGVRFHGYHAESSCLFIKYDDCTIADSEIITCSLSYLNKIQTKLIRGLTFYDVIDGKSTGMME